MEGLRRQRELRRSGKHFKEGRVKEVAYESPGGSITGFPCPLSSCRITLLWLCAFGFMYHKGEQPWCSCRDITSACLGSLLALVEQDPGTNAVRVKRSHTLTVGGRAGSSWSGPFWQLNGGCGKSKAMPTTDGFNSCGTFQQVSHPGVTPLHMRGSEGYLKK